MLLDLTNLNVSGKEGEHALDSVGIYTNKNMIPYDPRKPMDPSGMRIGTAALTTRGFNETEIQTVAELIVTTLKHVGNEEKLNDVRRRVRELSDAHPLYPGMSV